MNKSIKKFYFILILAVIILAAAFALTLQYSNTNLSAAGADALGESSVPPSSSWPQITVDIDVNGKVSPGPETARTDVETNNSLRYSSRALSINVFSNQLTGYSFDTDNDAPHYNPNKNYFEVTVDSPLFVTITAIKPLPAGYMAYAKMAVNSNAVPTQKTFVYFKINVSAVFVHGITNASEAEKILVGSKVENQSYVKTLINNSLDEINLGDLVDTMLYKTDETYSFISNNLYRDSNNSNNAWTLKDTRSFNIIKVTFPDIDKSIIEPQLWNSTDSLFSPFISFKVKITNEALSRHTGAFWTTDASPKSFPLKIEIGLPNDKKVELYYHVQFQVSSEPILKESFKFPTEINAGSSEEYSESTSTHYTEVGYKVLNIYAENIVEFPRAKLWFGGKPTVTQNKITVEPVVIPGSDVSDPDNLQYYYRVMGIENGTGFVTFDIKYIYPLTGTIRSMSYKIGFNIYGKYSMDKIIVNGSQLKENINSSKLFTQFTNDNFILSSAKVLDSEIATADMVGNELIIFVNRNGITEIALTFTSYNGRKITVNTELDVNKERGDWWAPLLIWQKVLIIVGASLLAIVLILLIIWLFIRGIAKSRREQNETTIPTSSYIVKLNSTIAATQAQQKLVTQGYGAANPMMQTLQLGAGPTMTQAPSPSTLQLNVAQNFGAPQGPAYSQPIPPSMSSGTYNININNAAPEMPVAPPPAANLDDIYIPMSDEALIERIYVEKYEPRGMTRRSFFKSRDLQIRELEKEKTRIRENVRSGMSMDEAMKSDKEREQAVSGVKPESSTAPVNDNDPLLTLLGFDPNAPIVVKVEEEIKDSKKDKKKSVSSDGNKLIYDEVTEEDEAYDYAKREHERIVKEIEQIKSKRDKAHDELTKVSDDISALKESCESLSAEIKAALEEITDLEIKLSSAKGKDKDRLSKELVNVEERVKDKKSKIANNEKTIVEKENIYEQLVKVVESFDTKLSGSSALLADNEKEVAESEKNAKAAQERAIKAKQQQDYERQFNALKNLFTNVARCDKTVRTLTDDIENKTQERVALKSEVSLLQTQLLSTSDATIISNMSEAIKEKNKRVNELDKAITVSTKQKSDANIELSGHRKKANDFIDRENIEVESVLKMEDAVLAQLALEEELKQANKDKQEAEDRLASLQEIHDNIESNFHQNLEAKAAAVAEETVLAEIALREAEAELNALNSSIESASDDDKLMLSIEQMTLTEKVDELKKEYESKKTNGIKNNIEYKIKCEEEMRLAAEELEKAKADYESAAERISRFSNLTALPELITSGSGIISQDRQLIEQNNLKKQLEKSQNAIEQAKLQAKMAQMEAEKAIIDAERASAASKEQAELAAKQAIEKADEARKEAEAKALEEAEKARQEIDRVKQQAAEETEKLRTEAENAKRAAEAESEKARKEAEAETERAKREAEEEAQRARKEAEDETQRLRREAEEDAQRMRKEAEDEANKAKLRAEEDARNEAAKKAEEARVAAKVTKRKEEIAELRRGIKSVSTDAEGAELKEKFYNLQLRFDEDEKSSTELRELIERSINDTMHASEVAHYKAMANQAPKRVIHKVTERVNSVQRTNNTTRSGTRSADGTRPAGARPAGARPAGARPAGARPASAGTRPAGARPASAGTRPAGARPASAGTRPAGARPASAGTRPAGARPASAGARPASAGARPASAGARPAGERPASGTRPAGTRPAGTRSDGTRPPRQ